MDVLLPILQVLFFVPVVVRVASQSGARAQAELQDPMRSLRESGIVIHCVGGLLLFGATVLGLVDGQVERSVSLRGLLGGATIVVGATLLTWSLVALHSWRFLPVVDADHELCITGPYALVRHPNYLALDFLGLGSLIWLASVPMVIAVALLIVGGDLRARVEERVLVASFGGRYRDYMKRVPRMIPGVY